MRFDDTAMQRSRSTKRRDADLEAMAPAELKREAARLRKAVRKHRDAVNNARCWHNDLALYGALPEGSAPGKMTDPEEVLLRNCARYIRRQQCRIDCPITRKKSR